MSLTMEIVTISVVVAIAMFGMLRATERKQEIMWSIAILAMSAMFLATVGKENRNLYPATMAVKEIDEERNLMTLVNATGYTYQVYGIEDYIVTDVVALIMDGKGTDIITDDEIVNMRYTGFRQVKKGE